MENTQGELNSSFSDMNRTVLVTGGATGIGKAIVRELAANGYDIAFTYLNSEKQALELQKEITDTYKVKCLTFKTDVSNEDEVDKTITSIENELGNIDILINNAAIDLSNLYHLKTAEEFRRTLDVNVVGAYNCCKRVADKMMEKQYGRIINISSTNGMNTYYPMSFDYDASKAALNSLTHDLAVQYAPYIHVNAIAPGFIGTEKELDGYDEEFLKEETDKILLKRYGKPEEVARLVRFLISDDADYINNSIIRIDGGQTGSY